MYKIKKLSLEESNKENSLIIIPVFIEMKQVWIIGSYLSLEHKHKNTKQNLQEKYHSKCNGKLKYSNTMDLSKSHICQEHLKSVHQFDQAINLKLSNALTDNEVSHETGGYLQTSVNICSPSKLLYIQ
jgi:hypothetical protein